MSTHDDGYGRKAGPSPGSQSDFRDKKSIGGALGGQTWGNNALDALESEVTLMAHGGRPAQPASGQRPIFVPVTSVSHLSAASCGSWSQRSSAV